MPSTLLDARQITRRYAARTVLDTVDVHLDAGSRVGLVGPNGAGKSTLLRILAGLEAPDRGTVRRLGTVGYLPQMADASEPRLSVRQLILERVGVAAASRELERWAATLQAGRLDAIELHAAALERWVALGGDDLDARLARAAAELGLEQRLLERRLETLSGGQSARAGLAALAVARFDAVLLDEPTNHLDDDGLDRLRELLRSRSGGVVLVSHDRDFLSDTVDEIVELDAHTGRATRFRGGWDAFERERGAGQARARAEHAQALARRAVLIAAERESRRRAAASANRARARVHDNDKNSREWVRMRAEEMAGRARKLGDRGRRAEIPPRPWEHPTLRLELTAGEHRQPFMVALETFVARRGDWSLGPIDLDVANGERILITGPNGSGKSTLLAALAGDLQPAHGRRRQAPGTVIAHFEQTHATLRRGGRLADRVRELTGLDEQSMRTALASFGLRGEAANRNVVTLSPGERTRAALAVIGQLRATCLLLDEPTNHLDVESLEILAAALDGWSGALVVASHDRRLSQELRINRKLALNASRASHAHAAHDEHLSS